MYSGELLFPLKIVIFVDLTAHSSQLVVMAHRHLVSQDQILGLCGGQVACQELFSESIA